MGPELVLKDLREQFGQRSVLYSEDIAALLGKSVAAVDSLRSRGGFPLPVIQVGGRPAVSIHAVADWLSGETAATPAAKPQKAQQAPPSAPPVPAPKRAGESLGKYLLSVRLQRDFLFELDAEIEKVLLGMNVEKPDTPKDARPTSL